MHAKRSAGLSSDLDQVGEAMEVSWRFEDRADPQPVAPAVDRVLEQRELNHVFSLRRSRQSLEVLPSARVERLRSGHHDRPSARRLTNLCRGDVREVGAVVVGIAEDENHRQRVTQPVVQVSQLASVDPALTLCCRLAAATRGGAADASRSAGRGGGEGHDPPTPLTCEAIPMDSNGGVPEGGTDRLRLSVSSLRVSDGRTVSVPRGGVVLFVGPNNAGKSQALRDIYSHLTLATAPSTVVTHVEADREGGEAAVRAWLTDHAFPNPAEGQPDVSYLRNGHSIPASQAVAHWRTEPRNLGPLAPMLVFHAAAEQRLGLVGSTQSYDPINQPPSTPLQVLYTRSDLADRLSDAAYAAFGHHLTVNRAAGPMVHLHVGRTEELPLPDNAAYQQAVRQMPLVQQQGDGMKSLVVLLLALVTPGHQIVLVDEPEAFLHPPQARLLSRLLADEHPDEAQLFIATHSADVVQGFLDASSDVTIVRLERSGNVNASAVLEPTRVHELGREPLLRYSEILEGLFHTGVVLCEGDADCRFYQGTLDVALSRLDHRPHDLLFTHCGGKARMPNVVRALRAVAVPVRVIADLDVLNDQGTLRALVEALEGEWSSIEPDWRVLDSQVRNMGSPPLLSAIREQIERVFDEAGESRLNSDITKSIRDLT